MAATLTLTRRRIGVQRRPFEITIDGTVLGAVARQQTVELPIESGPHTLRLGSGRRVSPQRTFDATDEQTIRSSCHGAAIWPIYLASAVRPDLGIALKKES